MGTKLYPGKYDCYGKANANEPMFILLARDQLAPMLVTLWAAVKGGAFDSAKRVTADLLERAYEESREPTTETRVSKILEARRCAIAMQAYQKDEPYCHVCLCTEDTACVLHKHTTTCSWANAEKTICSNPSCMEAAGLISPGTYISYYVHRNDGGAVFVKEANFFEQQGGLTEKWGRAWKKIRATSIEHAREIGQATLP